METKVENKYDEDIILLNFCYFQGVLNTSKFLKNSAKLILSQKKEGSLPYRQKEKMIG
jgi:hypothetical protein